MPDTAGSFRNQGTRQGSTLGCPGKGATGLGEVPGDRGGRGTGSPCLAALHPASLRNLRADAAGAGGREAA